METIRDVIQIFIALGIYNVWIFRFGKSTGWRGGNAANMTQEFAAYGLSYNFMVMIGFLKISFATLLLIGLWYPFLTKFAALGLAVLMVGAIGMHFKVRDPIKKYLPSFIMLVLCLIVLYLSQYSVIDVKSY